MRTKRAKAYNSSGSVV